MAKESYSSSQLASFGGEQADIGTYGAKLTKIEAKEGEGEKSTNWVSLTLEILDKGENEGLTTWVSLFPSVTKSPKNGKLYSRGLFEAQQFAAAWGAPLPEFSLDEFINDTKQGGTRTGTTVKGARMLQKLLGDSFKKAGAPRLKIKIVQEKVQEKDERTEKWVDKKDEQGNQVYRKVTFILGKQKPEAEGTPANVDAPVATDGGAQHDVPEEEAPQALNFV